MISFDNVSYRYQGVSGEGIEHISLEIKPGECILLCGRSGCGKTTLTRMVNDLIPHFYQGEMKGSVQADQMVISHTPLYQIGEKAGSVFQNPRTQFFNVDTDSEIVFGMENLAYPQERMKTRLREAVNDLKIEHLLGRSIFELSGGEKQKIAFASVYAMNPQIYILDEPSSNLDIRAIEEMRKILLMLKAQGKTILIAEHRLYYLRELADRIAYMEEGQIKKVYTNSEFARLSKEKREGMGLRAMDLNTVFPVLKASVAGGEAEKEKEETVPPVLEIKNLNIYYNKLPVMSGIDLKAGLGEVIGIIGQNGAGKSTFLRTLCGLHAKYSGTFLWKGMMINDKKRLKLSYMVMQETEYQLFAESVEKECTLGMEKPDHALCDKTLAQLGLDQYKKRHPHTLSGGQKQRTAIAVSVLCQKEILIFDEPTSGLDYDSMLRVAELISRLAAEGKVIFIVTHDYELLNLVCTRVIHFTEGRIKDDFPLSCQNLVKLKKFFRIPDSVAEIIDGQVISPL